MVIVLAVLAGLMVGGVFGLFLGALLHAVGSAARQKANQDEMASKVLEATIGNLRAAQNPQPVIPDGPVQ